MNRSVTSRRALIAALLALLLASAAGPGTARATRREDPLYAAAAARWLTPLRERLKEVRREGGLRYTPRTYTAADSALARLDARLRADPDTTAPPEPELARARLAVQRAEDRIAAVQAWRSARYGWQAALEDYDALVADVAAVAGIALPPVLTGPPAGRAVVDSLARRWLRLRTRADSLAGANRRLSVLAGAEASARDSLVTALRREVSRLRQQVWDLQLRAEAVEADRGAVAAEVRRQREREAFLRSLPERFGDQAEVLLTPDGAIRLRLTGLRFASGSSWLNPRYDGLLEKVADVIRRFPRARVRVEGHTDDRGSRDVNLRLSRQRAERVARALAGMTGRPADDFQVTGLGPDHPIAPNSSAAGRARNRRIEVVIAPPPTAPADSGAGGESP